MMDDGLMLFSCSDGDPRGYWMKGDDLVRLSEKEAKARPSYRRFLESRNKWLITGISFMRTMYGDEYVLCHDYLIEKKCIINEAILIGKQSLMGDLSSLSPEEQDDLMTASFICKPLLGKSSMQGAKAIIYQGEKASVNRTLQMNGRLRLLMMDINIDIWDYYSVRECRAYGKEIGTRKSNKKTSMRTAS